MPKYRLVRSRILVAVLGFGFCFAASVAAGQDDTANLAKKLEEIQQQLNLVVKEVVSLNAKIDKLSQRKSLQNGPSTEKGQTQALPYTPCIKITIGRSL